MPMTGAIWEALDTALRQGLSRRARNALYRAYRHDELTELPGQTSDLELAAVRNIGRSALAEIRRYFPYRVEAATNFEFRPLTAYEELRRHVRHINEVLEIQDRLLNAAICLLDHLPVRLPCGECDSANSEGPRPHDCPNRRQAELRRVIFDIEPHAFDAAAQSRERGEG